MRSVKQLPTGTPQNTDLNKFPDGGIINETPTTQGTPAVEEIIGDILSNVYAILRAVKMEPNGVQDNATTQYQLLEALRLLTNELNDKERILNIEGSVLSLDINLALLPDKYFLFARPTGDISNSISYTIKGNGIGVDDISYNFISDKFLAGDELLLIIDQSGVRAYNIKSSSSETANELFTVFGSPLSFNDSANLWYQSDNYVFNDKPQSFNLKTPIVSILGTEINVLDIVLFKGFFICLVFLVDNSEHKIFKFSVSDLTTPIEINLISLDFPAEEDNKPHMFTDGTKFYVTNDCGNSASDGNISVFTVDSGVNNFTFISTLVLTSFVKTTNFIFKPNYAYSLISNNLYQYNLSNGANSFVNSFVGYVGLLFMFNGNTYYSSGEVAKKWDMPII